MTNKFNCSEAELFLGLVMIGRALEGELVAFGELKGKYNAGFVADFLGKVAEAERLPSEKQRVAGARVRRVELRGRVLGEMDRRMGFLKSYIREAYKHKEDRVVRLREAGFEEWRVAKQMNWEVVKGVLKKVVKFLEVHEGNLMAGLNMPMGFKEEFGVMAEEMREGIDGYLKMRMELKLLRQNKVVACNAVYKLGMEICADGKVLFKRNPAKLGRFTWKVILGVITPPGAASLRGVVKRKGSFEVMEGVEVRLTHPEKVAIVGVTDLDGRFDIRSVPGAGVWRMIVLEGDVVLWEEDVKLRTGVRSFRSVVAEAG